MPGRPHRRELARMQMLQSANLVPRVPADPFEVDVLTPLEDVDLSARPIDPDLVLRLASLHMDEREIAAALDMPQDRVHSMYGALISRGHAESVIALRRAQWRVAIAGNVSMLIHLGEQHLSQQTALTIKDERVADNPLEKLIGAVKAAAERLEGRRVRDLPEAEIIAKPEEF